jgi:hypothetical protein
MLEEIMGGLIQTAGTKRLAAHYNEEFDQFIEFYRGSNVIGVFDRGPLPGKPLNVWDDVIQQIQHNSTTDPAGDFPDHTDRGDGLCLLPNDRKTHKNLLNRWRLYLRKILPQAQHNDLIDAIFNVLKDHTISYIVFDVVQTAAWGIATANHVDSDGNNYKTILLQTMVELPVDPGFGPNFIRDHRPI